MVLKTACTLAKFLLKGACSEGESALQLDHGLKQFLKQPLMIILGTADRVGRPAIGRGMGVFESEQDGHLDLIFSTWQWPDTATYIRETGRLAVTLASPSSYTSYQMKGKAWLRHAKPDDIERSDDYIEAIDMELQRLGVPPKLTLPWLCNREPLVATLNVSEIYVQTPGPRAGMATGYNR